MAFKKVIMKRGIVFGALLIVLITVTGLAAFKGKGKPPLKEKTAAKGFAVVELFTSQGCSSCPPAEEALAALLAKNLDNVYILSYHVDYWDRLGWKDEFSQHSFSTRQSQYAQHLGLNGVYTPQAIVNGKAEFVGSNTTKLNNEVSNGIEKASTSNLVVTAEKKDNAVLVNYTITGDETVLLNAALVIPAADTKVMRGENGGRTLHHVNVVSNLTTQDAKGSGQISIMVPKTLEGKPYKLIAYTQNKKTFSVAGATEVDL